jgi:hypothetical protein
MMMPVAVQFVTVDWLQDEEDAKKGLYNWFARSQHLLTPLRIALSTLFTSSVVALATDPCTACIMMAMLTLFAVGAVVYSHRIIQVWS